MLPTDLNFSIFEGGISQTDKPINVNLKGLFDYYKNASLQVQHAYLKQLLPDKKTQALNIKYKKLKLPNFTPSGVFNKRNKDGITWYNSNIIMLDIDHVTDTAEAIKVRDQLKLHPSVILAVLSPLQKGVKALVYTDQTTTKETDAKTILNWIPQIAKELKIKDYMKDIDPIQLNYWQTCFFSYDPEGYFNLTPEALKITKETILPVKVETPPQSTPITEYIQAEADILITIFNNTTEGDGRHLKIAKVKRIAGLCLEYTPPKIFVGKVKKELLQAVVSMYESETDGNCKNSFISAWDTATNIKAKELDAILKPKGSLNPLVFIPNPFNRPEKKPPILSLNNVSLLTAGNVAVLVAPIGLGKSSVCEAILSKVINPECDGLGFSINGIDKALFIDCERTLEDTWDGYARMLRRAGMLTTDKIMISNLRLASEVTERKTIIEELIQEFNPSLIVIDGAGDLVKNTNDIEETPQLKSWLRRLAHNYNLTILTTIHPNPSTNNDNKLRGHLGTALMHEAEAIFTIKKAGLDRIITTDFTHGKNRNSGNASGSFGFCEVADMFITKDNVIPSKNLSTLTLTQKVKLVAETLGDGVQYQKAIDRIQSYLKLHHADLRSGISAIKEFLPKLVDEKLAVKTPDKLYQKPE